MAQTSAATLALRVLAWLIERQQVDKFLAVSGLAPSELRAGAQDPEVLAGVLAYVLSNEALAAEYCGSEAVPAQDLHIAHQVLGDAR